MIRRNKVAVVGAGMVGSAVAFSLINQGLCDDVVLIDINQDKARAEALDLENCMEYLNRNMKVYAADYDVCKDADIVIITAGAPYEDGKDRLDMLSGSAKMIKEIVPAVMQSGFNGHFIIISNPVDVLSYYVYRLSGLPKNQVIGTGTALDTARLKNLIADLVEVDPRSIHAFSMGEHGDSQMIPWSKVIIGGKQFREVMRDNPEKLGNIELGDLLAQTAKLGWEIVASKGSTNYGIAATTAGVVKAILHDENKIIPVSALLDGEYGEKEVYMGVPCILNRSGIKEVVELHLTEPEQKAFHSSADILRKYIEKLF